MDNNISRASVINNNNQAVIFDKIAQNIIHLLNQKEISVTKLSKDLGLNKANLYTFLNRHNTVAKTITIIRIAAYLNVSIDYLIYGDVNLHAPTNTETINKKEKQNAEIKNTRVNNKRKLIPIVKHIDKVVENIDNYLNYIKNIPDNLIFDISDEIRAFNVDVLDNINEYTFIISMSTFGNSMAPTLNNKDLLVCQNIYKKTKINNGSIYIFKNSNNEVFLRRIIFDLTNGGYKLVQDNPDYTSEIIPKSDFYNNYEIIAVITNVLIKNL